MEGHDAETNMSSTHTGSHVKTMVCFIRLRLSSTFSVQGKLFKFVSAVLAQASLLEGYDVSQLKIGRKPT